MSAHSSQQLDEDLVRRIDERVSESLSARRSGNDTSDP